MSGAGEFASPEAAPLYPPGPYHSRDCRRVRLFARAEPQAVRRFLPACFEPLGEAVELFFMATSDATPLQPYRAAGLVVPCRYGALTGSHILCEYVTDDVALAMAREVWGYPKKLADISFEESEAGVSSRVSRGGVTLLAVDFTFGGPEPERFEAMPRLQRKTIPAADGQGLAVDQIVANQILGQTLRVQRPGRAEVRVESGPQDPWGQLGPLQVSGAEFVVADFTVGYCRILEDRLERR